jgi:hypothetical protein
MFLVEATGLLGDNDEVKEFIKLLQGDSLLR